MVLFNLHYVSMVVVSLPIISCSWLPQISIADADEVNAEYENEITDFVDRIIDQEICGGVITEFVEPRDPDSAVQMLNKKGCFMCKGICYPVEDLVNDPRGDVNCFHIHRIRRHFAKICHQFADIMNEKGLCDGGSYRCYGEDVHESLERPLWKPVCVCEGYGGIGCISSFVEKRKCSVAVQGADERYCDCIVNVNLQ